MISLHKKNAEIALRDSEIRYKSLFEYSGVSISYYRPNSEIIYFNQKASNDLGLSPQLISGKTIYDLFSQKGADLLLSRLNQALLSDAPQEYEDTYVSKSHDKSFLRTFSRIVDCNETVLGVQVISQDITSQKRIEEELRKAKIASDEANNSKTQFLANMSHEIRTPLNGIMGTLQLLKTSTLEQSQRELVEISESSSEALLNIINDILDYSKISADQLELERLEFDLQHIFNDIQSLFSLSLKEKGLDLSFYVDERIPVLLIGDSFKLRQILSNLVGNAIKFTQKGGITIDVKCLSNHSRSPIELEFVVKDSGIGIAFEKQEKIFNSFNQVDNSNTRLHDGVGLGLSIAKGLVEKMGGRYLGE